MSTTKTKRITKKKATVEMMPMFKNLNEQMAYKQKLFKKQKKAGFLSIIGKMPEAQELLDALLEEQNKKK